MSVDHDTFAVERTYGRPPARVFAAWATLEAKGRWWGGDAEHHELDFRVGGREVQRGVDLHDQSYVFRAVYQDIVPDRRIVYSYDMVVDGARISVSLATVELHPQGDGTRLVYTEQAAFLDGGDSAAQRSQGMGSLLDALGAELGS